LKLIGADGDQAPWPHRFDRPEELERSPQVRFPLPREETLADDKSKAGGQDRLRINVHEDYELRDWSQKFGVTPDRLKQAVAAVGVMAADVEQYLKTP
jgi:hypothetical protein